MSENIRFNYTNYQNAIQLIEDQVELTPQNQAINYNEKSLSYSQLNASANCLANFLIEKGSTTNSLIGICLDRSIELGITVLGIIKSGAAYVPFDPDYPTERISYMLQTSKCNVLITQQKYAPLFNDNDCELIIWEDTVALINEQSTENPNVAINKDDLLYILFTSGSTGMPKGVAMRHEPLVNLALWQKNETTLVDAANTLQFAPISFDVSAQEFITTWSTGGCLFMIDDNMRLNALSLLKFIENNSIERLYLPFIALQHISEIAVDNQIFPTSLKDIVTAGEQLQITKQVVAFFKEIPDCLLHNHYGPTETHVVTAYTLEGSPDEWDALPSIGKAIANDTIYLLDENLYPVKRGEEGELYVGGVGLAKGYLYNDELTKERFLPDPFSDDENSRMYKTGDLAKEFSDGNIQYLGRKDGQVKIRGYRIELGEIELTIAQHESVNQVIVVPREDKPGLKRLVAYIVAKEAQPPLDINALRIHITEKLPDYMMPSAFVKMEELPRTPSGKIDRRNLPAPDTKRPELNEAFIAAIDEKEKQLAALWSELLLVDEIGIADNFFELGGNSLLALQFIAKYHHHAGIEIPVVKLYQYPTIKSLLKFLDNAIISENLIEQAKERKQDKNAPKNELNTVADGIAVIGLSGVFPGAKNIDALWKNLLSGVESTTFFKPEELSKYISPEIANDPNYVAARGIIDADLFDAAFFGMNPKLAEITDPQQRIFLELAWTALENSGHAAENYKGLIGVFAGVGNNTYYLNNVLKRPDVVERIGSFQTMLSNEKDYVSTLTSYLLNLKGPAISVHTACSTSLVAIVNAVKSLRNFDCDIALAGGITVTAPVNSGHLYAEGAMYSKDGFTRPFDAEATGTTFSDGGGVVVLKRYADAVKDNDVVLAVIRGVALNNDGHDKASFTAPSVQGQATVVAMAVADANVDVESITYIETHGTATPIGDPIEMEALATAFRNQTDKKQFCAVGSIKSNFGHLTAAAGVAGLIKTVLSLKHKQLPATLNFNKPNPAIDFANSPFYVNAQLTEWKSIGPRRAGVSSFGVGGTNAHLIVEEAPEIEQHDSNSRPVQLLMLSAKSQESLDKTSDNLVDFLENNKTISLPNIAYSLHTSRKHFNYRKFITATSVDEAIALLKNNEPKRSAAKHSETKKQDVVFMFPGQGAQYVNMGLNLYHTEAVFREAVDACCEGLLPWLNLDLREVLFPENDDIETASQSLNETKFTQPALFTIGYSLAQLWMSWGIKPAALIGHSIGELVAACLAGVLSLNDALKLIANRGQLMQNLERGSMLSVRMSAEEIQPRLTEELAIAAINGPNLCVVSGTNDAITLLQLELENEEVVCKLLHTSHAFHSPMMDEIVIPFLEIVNTITLNNPQVPIYSTVTAQRLTDADATDPMYWAKHLRETVQFAKGIENLWLHNPDYVLLECGPRTTAATLARQQATDIKKQIVISSLSDNWTNEAENIAMQYAIGQLWLNGIHIDFDKFYADEKRQKVQLPTYAFDHKSYWLNPAEIPTINIIQNPALNNSSQQQTDISVNQNQTMQAPVMDRKENLIKELMQHFEDASGIAMGNDANSMFTELGLDSLFLTQAASLVSKKYGQKITFRQLNESLSSFASLAAYLDERLPAPAIEIIAAAPLQNTLPAVVSAQPMSNDVLQQLMMQQMQMQQQLLSLMSNQLQPATTNQAQPIANSVISSNTVNAISNEELAEIKKPYGAIARIEKKVTTELNAAQKKWLEDFTKLYVEKTKSSKQYTQIHRDHLADPRVVTGFKPNLKELVYQVVVELSKEAYVWDLDGNKYVDILNGFGSNMFGHSPTFIREALLKQMDEGYELGPQHPLAGEVAKLICEFTKFDRAALCNTGSEAVLGCMRMARTVTGRNLIVTFNGAYHGINDEVIVRGSQKLKSYPASAGIPDESVVNMLVLDYGTDESLKIIKERMHELAGVMVEPIQSRRADFKPTAFIKALRKLTEENDVPLIFDEVITGFRLAPNGAQEFFGVKADIASYGKVCGGGMPIGVMAGTKKYMDALDGGWWQYGDNSVPETGVTYFAGTFVRHPFALAAAKASLEYLMTEGPSLQINLNARTEKMVNELNAFCAELELPFHWATFASLFKMKYDTEFPYSELLAYVLRYKGIHFIDGFPCFLTTAHTDNDIKFIVDTHKEAITELVDLGIIPSNKFRKSEIAKPVNGSVTPADKIANKFDAATPPYPNARLGKDKDGNPAWFVADPNRPGKFMVLNS